MFRAVWKAHPAGRTPIESKPSSRPPSRWTFDWLTPRGNGSAEPLRPGFEERHLAVAVRRENLRCAKRNNGIHHACAELVLPLEGARLRVQGHEQPVLGPIEEDSVLFDQHGRIDVVAEAGIKLPGRSEEHT